MDLIVGYLKQLEPVLGILITSLLVANAYQWKNGINKDKEIERLRNERNTAVDKKDIDIKELHQQVLEVVKENSNINKQTNETLQKIGSLVESGTKSTDNLANMVFKVLAAK